jgi:hypothetical protein
MKLTSVLKARPLRVAAVGIAMIALGALPAFADTPYHGERDARAAVMVRDRSAGCDARASWFGFGWRRASACATVVHRYNGFDRYRNDMR